MNKLMMGNEAIAYALADAGCTFVSSYPGTPSTEITEYAAHVGGEKLYCEWATNEKVAAEAAIGASVAGARAFTAMKHVGLNVAADPIFTAAYTGVNGGLVIAVADDPGMHSSQNEQDSRHYAEASKLPMLEPANSQECYDFTRLAFELSERFDTPVYIRLSTRISHTRSIVKTAEKSDYSLKPYAKNVGKYVMMPNMARMRHVEVEKHLKALGEFSETAQCNSIIWGTERKIGIVAAGIAFEQAREALGDSACYLKLGMVFPLPIQMVLELAKNVDELWVIEELDDFIETHCKKHGVKVRGKSEFTSLGEYSADLIRTTVLGSSVNNEGAPKDAPQRPPVLCPGCPHRGLFHIASKLKLTVMGDIGCYTLGAIPPLGAMDFCLCMGASISSLHGFLKVRPDSFDKTIAVIGDSTFFHSGMTGLANVVYNQTPATIVILDNSITGMTGHQENPGTGHTLSGTAAPVIDIAEVCKSMGIKRVFTVDPHDVAAVEALLNRELAVNEPSVIITKRPCVLLKYVKKETSYKVDSQKCIGCKACMKAVCPALRISDNKVKVEIDEALCAGCGLCARLCKFGAITEVPNG